MRWLYRTICAALLSGFVFGTVSAQQQCGIGDNECEIPLGTYNIELPANNHKTEKIPAMIYFHGAGGSGQRALKNRNMVEAFNNRGFAVIAPSGLKRPNSRFGPGWSFHPNFPEQRNELEFTKAVLDDASKRFKIDRTKILMTGFSIGGSLTWYLACKDPDLAKAYAPIAGAFWRPHPVSSDCKGPINMLHTHGWRDGTVPLEGRVLGGGRIEQGDVFHSMRVLREVNGCENYKANQYDTSGKFWKRWWTKCTSGAKLQFNLYDGGHGVTQGWAEEAINWFEALD